MAFYQMVSRILRCRHSRGIWPELLRDLTNSGGESAKLGLRRPSGSVQFRGQVFRPLVISDDGRTKDGMSEPRERAGAGHLESHYISMGYEAEVSNSESDQISQKDYKPLIYNSFLP